MSSMASPSAPTSSPLRTPVAHRQLAIGYRARSLGDELEVGRERTADQHTENDGRGQPEPEKHQEQRARDRDRR